MKLALALFAICAAAGSARADVSILDNHKHLTIDCAKDATVSIVGNHNNVQLVGPCTAVSLSGNHDHVTIASAASIDLSGNENAVTIDAVDRLDVSGNRNVVTYKRAVTKDQAPKVTTSGKDDRVIQAK